MFNPKLYWNERLKNNYSIEGVGDITLGKYNKYLYFIRKIAFKNIIRKIKHKNKFSVVDVGAGTGFYINLLSKTNAKKITGVDISKHAIEQLKDKFNSEKFNFIEADISSEKLNFENIDIVTAFDVVYHIVDDEKYLNAMKNVNSLLKQNGYFIFSDNLVRHGKEVRIQHQASRSREFVFETLKLAGFEVIRIKPMFVLMNQSMYPKNIFAKYIFPHSERFIRKGKFWAHFFGILLTPIEIILVLLLNNSYSSEIVVCKKIRNI